MTTPGNVYLNVNDAIYSVFQDESFQEGSGANSKRTTEKKMAHQ